MTVPMGPTMEGPAVVRGEWGAMPEPGTNDWVIFHVPSGVAVGALPGPRLATLAHALRALGALPTCPNPSAVAALVARWLMDDLQPTTAGSRWALAACETLLRFQQRAWGHSDGSGSTLMA